MTWREYEIQFEYKVGKSFTVVSEENRKHLLRMMARLPKNASALEIGCFKGDSTTWFLDNGITKIEVIDTFEGSPLHKVTGTAGDLLKDFMDRLAKYEGRYEIHHGKSSEILPFMCMDNLPVFDFIYIDGSHESKDVILDSLLAFQLLKVGGILVWDDYGCNFFDDKFRNVAPAVDFFFGCHGKEIEVLEMGYQVSVKKL